VGQPELRKTLADPALLQLRQRISINCTLKPLMLDEVEQYIVHRLRVAGNADAISFVPQAIEIIFQHSRGIPRLINIICDFIMLAAFAEETNLISQEMASDVVADLDFEHHFWACEDDWGILEMTEPLAVAGGRPTRPGTELEQLLGEISQRLARIEQGHTPTEEGVLKELNYRISSLQNAFKYHVGETETLFTDFSRKLEQLRKGVLVDSPSGNGQEGQGRVRMMPPTR
jgi:hypothetical protein